jgi:carbon monoxide dehydrogenase subunit G
MLRRVDIEGVAELSFPVAQVYNELRELDGYADWLTIVRKVERVSDQPAWLVDLGAGIGPLRRTKRVRMIRAEDTPPSLVRFKRSETDERDHSAWVLTASLQSSGDARTHLTMHLHYGGLDWLPLVGLALREEIRRAGPRLGHRLASRAG